MGLTSGKTKIDEGMAQNARVVAFKDKLAKQTAGRLARKNRLICGIWGEPKTVKSGLALDFPDKQIYVLDWDDGCEPTWRTNWDSDPNIMIYNPLEVRPDGSTDWETTFNNLYVDKKSK